MDLSKVQEARDEAKRFLRKVDFLLASIPRKDQREIWQGGEYVPDGVRSATVRRSSLDLSRALALMRR